MMKSFFKKLSLVMALAMVVTMMAPAASAFAAELIIAGQNEAKADAKAEYSVAVDAEVDFKFYGAGAGWQKDFVWESLNPEIATVDQTGLVKGLKDGVATIKLTVLGEVATVKVVVGNGGINVDAFEAKQTTHNQFVVNFNKEVNYGRENVNLYRVFETDKGDVYVVWAVEKATLSEDKKSLTVQPYVDFNDGERYLVAFENIETLLNNGSSLEGVEYDEFTTVIGAIDRVGLSFSSKVDENTTYANKAYTNGEDAEEEIEVVLAPQLYCGDINLTEVYKDQGYMEYVLVNEEAVADWVVLSDNTLVFTKAGIPAQVEATYVFENAEGEEQTAPSVPTVIVSELLPKFAIDYVKEWSFVEGDWSWTKPDHSIRAGKDAKIALLLVDNRGGQWETVAKDGNIADFGADDTATEDMYLKFYSTDNDHFLVEEEGEEAGMVETYLKMNKAVVYVALHDEALLAESESDFVRNIGACVMQIADAAKFDSVAIFKGDKTASSVTLVTNAVVDPANTERFVKELTTAEYDIAILDQDKAKYDPAADKVLTNTEIKYTLSTTNKDVREGMVDDQTAQGAMIDGNKLYIDATELNEATKSSTITFTITATQYDENDKVLNTEKASFKVYLRDPELNDDETVKVTSWGLTAAGADLMTLAGKSTAKIQMTMLSKSHVVGFYNRYNMGEVAEAGEGVTIVTDAKKYEFGKGEGKIQEEGIYVLVVGPDGKAVKAATVGATSAAVTASATSSTVATSGALGVFVDEDYFIGVNVTADDNGDGDLDYLEKGKYTVKVTFVTDVKTENGKITDVEYKTRTANFQITDNFDEVKFVDMYDVESDRTVADENDDEIKNVIIENYKFKYDVDNDGDLDDFVPTADQIREVNCIVKGNYITVKSITFQIKSGDSYYVTVTRDINRAVKLGVEK